MLESATQAFISYASADGATANAVCAALEREGVKCWIAPRDVAPGEFYAANIVHAIDTTRVMVLVLSQHAADSAHVLREVERASSKRHPIIALRTDLEPLPDGLENFLNTSQWLDASAAGVERTLPRLVDAVKAALAKSSAAPPRPPSSPRRRPRGRTRGLADGWRRWPSSLPSCSPTSASTGSGRRVLPRPRDRTGRSPCCPSWT